MCIVQSLLLAIETLPLPPDGDASLGQGLSPGYGVVHSAAKSQSLPIKRRYSELLLLSLVLFLATNSVMGGTSAALKRWLNARSKQLRILPLV